MNQVQVVDMFIYGPRRRQSFVKVLQSPRSSHHVTVTAWHSTNGTEGATICSDTEYHDVFSENLKQCCMFCFEIQSFMLQRRPFNLAVVMPTTAAARSQCCVTCDVNGDELKH